MIVSIDYITKDIDYFFSENKYTVKKAMEQKIAKNYSIGEPVPEEIPSDIDTLYSNFFSRSFNQIMLKNNVRKAVLFNDGIEIPGYNLTKINVNGIICIYLSYHTPKKKDL